MSQPTDTGRAGPTPDVQALVASAIGRLASEFAGVFGAETVERFVRESLDQLSGARVRSFLPLLAERFARDRLWSLAKSEGKLQTDMPTVLFLCVHNAGRSQMAAGLADSLAAGRVKVMSGGSTPGAEINPHAVTAMGEIGVDISRQFPKPWTDEVVRAADVVVTMGCGDACPIFPGKRYEDWSVADPAEADLDAVRAIRDDLTARVRSLLESLGVAS